MELGIKADALMDGVQGLVGLGVAAERRRLEEVEEEVGGLQPLKLRRQSLRSDDSARTEGAEPCWAADSRKEDLRPALPPVLENAELTSEDRAAGMLLDAATTAVVEENCTNISGGQEASRSCGNSSCESWDRSITTTTNNNNNEEQGTGNNQQGSSGSQRSSGSSSSTTTTNNNNNNTENTSSGNEQQGTGDNKQGSSENQNPNYTSISVRRRASSNDSKSSGGFQEDPLHGHLSFHNNDDESSESSSSDEERNGASQTSLERSTPANKRRKLSMKGRFSTQEKKTLLHGHLRFPNSQSNDSSEDDDDEEELPEASSSDEERNGASQTSPEENAPARKRRKVSMKGRFSTKEKEILFDIIRSDENLLRSFLHQSKRRIWQGKSWMHEIGARFNKQTQRKRSHDAVRHHLKLRRSTNSKPVGRSQEDQDLINLLEHAEECSKRHICTRCLQLDRLRIKRGYAVCGLESCDLCDPDSAPSVQEGSFNPAELRRRIVHDMRANNGDAANISPTGGPARSLSQGGLRSSAQVADLLMTKQESKQQESESQNLVQPPVWPNMSSAAPPLLSLLSPGGGLAQQQQQQQQQQEQLPKGPVLSGLSGLGGGRAPTAGLTVNTNVTSSFSQQLQELQQQQQQQQVVPTPSSLSELLSMSFSPHYADRAKLLNSRKEETNLVQNPASMLYSPQWSNVQFPSLLPNTPPGTSAGSTLSPLLKHMEQNMLQSKAQGKASPL